MLYHLLYLLIIVVPLLKQQFYGNDKDSTKEE